MRENGGYRSTGLAAGAAISLPITVQSSSGIVTPTAFTTLSLEGPRITSARFADSSTILVDGYGLDSQTASVTVLDDQHKPVPYDRVVAVVEPDPGKLKIILKGPQNTPCTVGVMVNGVTSTLATT
jgi:hypothetical protein